MADPCYGPGPICTTKVGDGYVDPGTNALTRNTSPADRDRSQVPRSGADSLFLYSDGVKAVTDGAFTVAPELTWDAYWRLHYDKIAQGIQEQAKALLERGNITEAEAKVLVNGRNEVLLQIRKQLGPFGEMYSEFLKPSKSLKYFEQFLEEKGTIEAVLSSVGKTRAVVDRIAIASRIAGPLAIGFEVVLTATVIKKAPEAERKRVAYRQTGRLIGSLSFGTAGMWAGCAYGAALASPTLVIPAAGEAADGTACLIGGIIGGFVYGSAGQELGEQAGDDLYQMINSASPFAWENP